MCSLLFLSLLPLLLSIFFFFNDTATTEIYTLSLHDALPISWWPSPPAPARAPKCRGRSPHCRRRAHRSEEHTSELQSQSNLVCRLLLEKKKKAKTALERPLITHARASCWMSVVTVSNGCCVL